MSTLELEYWTTENGWEPLWSGPEQDSTSSASSAWLGIEVAVPLWARVLRFVATAGSNGTSRTAVDNVVATLDQLAECAVSSASTASCGCSFESGCVWSYGGSWRRISGGTPSQGTGPSAAAEGENYLYIEASIASINASAFLLSPLLNASKVWLLSFAYHMHGDNVGSLVLEYQTAEAPNFFREEELTP